MAKREKASVPRVYSYIRFSTPEQALGDSERRQLAGAKAYAAKLGVPFDEDLRMTDRGLSAFHGDHRKKGALGQFLARVQAEEIPSGSTLVVENVDRLSRQDVVDVFSLITDLIRSGISIHTLKPEDTYDRQSLNGGQVWKLVGQVQLAHDESVKKSDRLSAAWAEKRRRAADGEVMTRRTPAWLRVKDGRYEVIDAAVEAVRTIFDLKLKGMGKGLIATTLNRTPGAWRPPKGWRPSYIVKILSNRAVMGEYQPHTGRGSARKPDGDPLPDYYPAIVEPDVFHAVQVRLKENRGKGGETGKALNLLSSLVKCAYCDGSVHYVSKGDVGYLICDNGRRGVRCKSHSIRYDECEKAILENCRGLRPEQVLPDPNEQARQCEALRKRLAGLDGKLADIAAITANLMGQIERTPSAAMRDRYEARIVQLDSDKAKLEADRRGVEQELVKAETALQSFDTWKRGMSNLQAALAEHDGIELRLRIRTHLRELIDKIDVFAVGFSRQSDPRQSDEQNKDTEDLADYVREVAAEVAPATLKTKDFAAFCRYVTQQRMSKAGRFLRVHFKTGAVRDVVPKGSVASGRGLEVDEEGQVGWRIVRPDIEKLRREYKHQGRRVRS